MLKRIKIGVVAMLVAIVLLLILILKSHSFQSFLINRFIAPIEKKSNVGIEFERSGFDIFEGFFIEKLEVFDNNGETLLTLDELHISPRSTLLSIIKNDFSFNSLNLRGIDINIQSPVRGEPSNWDRLLSSFQSDNKEEAAAPITFIINELRLDDVTLRIDDNNKEIYGLIELEKLELSSNEIDLSNRIFDLESLLLVDPRVQLKVCDVRTDESDNQPNEIQDQDSSTFLFNLNQLSVLRGNVKYNTITDDLNDAFYSLDDVDIVVDDLTFKDITNFSLNPRDISLTYNDHLVINHISSKELSSDVNGLDVDGLIVRSNMGFFKLDGRASTAQAPWTDHTSEIQFDLDVRNTYIDVNNLKKVIPGLEKQKWYKRSDIGRIFINGKVNGNLEDISLYDAQIVAPGLFTYAGDFEITNIQNLESALINVSLDKSLIHLDNITKRIPNIKIPDEIKRLGEVSIEGQFDGFKDNFVAEASLDSELGSLNFDLNFDISEENQYSGLLEMNSFDLGALLNQEDLGKMSFTADISEGRGLNLETLDAVFSAEIDTIQYKGYTYSNATFNGQMSNESIDGNFKIDDGVVDFDFNGRLDFTSDVPVGKFKIDIDRIDLCQTNLTNFPCEISLSASIDMFGRDMNSMQGTAILDSIYMKKDDKELYLDYLNISSTAVDQGMLLELESNELDAKVRGVFDVLKMHKVLLGLLVADYPDIAQRLNVKSPSGLKGDEEFDFAVDVKDMEKVLDFVNSKQLLEIKGELRGRWSATKGLTSNSYNLRSVGLNGIQLSNVLFNLDSKKGDGTLSLYIDELLQGDRIIDGFEITSKIKESEIFFQLNNHDGQKNKINISGKGNPWGDGFRFVFNQNLLSIDSVDWVLDTTAKIAYRDNQVLIDNFVLASDDRTIVLDDINGKGVLLSMDGFDLSMVNPILDYDKLLFSGNSNIEIQARNIFKEREVSVDLEVSDFTINEQDYGSLKIFGTEGTNDLIDLSVRIEKDTQSLDVLAYYDLKESLLNADISILDYPMSIFEFIIDDGISQTAGTTDVNARIYGPLDSLKVQGQGIIKDGWTRIDYLGERYQLGDQIIRIDENKIDLTGLEMIDHLGNTANLTGQLNHNVFADFSADLTISSPRFVALNTTSRDNDSYYGLGLGDVTVSFVGPFDAIDIRVDATAESGSVLNIPLESTVYSLDQGFVNFDYKTESDSLSDSDDPFEAIRLSGADFEMELTFTPEAIVNVIFDQSVNEVLSAKGDGDLRVIVRRDGTFEIFGNYLVESGDYLYSAYGITAKRFLLRRGGTVRWTGDPYNAILNVEADYTGMRAPLDIFLSEFLVSASEAVKNEAKNRTDVALKLKLGGTLFQPDVDFGISFPNVVGELKTYTDNKMRALSTTENGINNQVFGLMFFNNFLPSNNPLANISGSTLGQTGNNTITEFFSSQLSLLVSDALSDLIKDGTFINDIDFDIALSQNTSFLDGQSAGLIGGFVDFVPDQVGVNVRPSFKNDNWALNVGTNYVRASEVNNVNYLTGDFALDWFITNDKKLKLRFYGDFDYDEAFASRKQRYGFGINYRREFGKMSDLTETLKRIAEDIKDQSGDK